MRNSERGDADKDRLIGKALDVFENIGADLHYDKAVELLKANGCTVEGDKRVKFPRELVMKCLDMVPEKVQMYNRDGSEDDVPDR